MKSMETSRHIRSGISKGFRRPHFFCLQMVEFPQVSQLRTKRRMSLDIFGQKNCLATWANVASRPGWPLNIESWVVWMIFVYKGLWFRIQRRSRCLSKPLRISHSEIDTWSLRSAGNRRDSLSTASRACIYAGSAVMACCHNVCNSFSLNGFGISLYVGCVATSVAVVF